MQARRWWWGVFGLLALLALLSPATRANNVEEIETRMRRDITYLASKECEGRGVQTEGLNRAANYIAEQFEKAGLKPAGVNNTWYQPFTVSGGASEGPASLTLIGPLGQAIELVQGKDFNVLGLSASGKVKAPLVFAGYGITAPELNYDDYKGLHVAGKVVLVIRKTPRYDHKHVPFGPDQQKHAAFQAKVSNAELNKAAAMIVVNDITEAKLDRLEAFSNLAAAPTPGSIPAIHLKRDIVDGILRSSLGTGLRDLENDIASDLKPRSSRLVGWSARLETNVTRKSVTVKNVIGMLEGKGPLANETVVIGAHYDHLGLGNEGGSLGGAKAKNQIHHGADDNASGTTAVIELARRFAAMKNREGRRLVFITFTAEEKGLLGSKHYCSKDPRFPLKDTVAMLNLDMVGRLQVNAKTNKEKLLIEGAGTAKHFDSLIKQFNKKYDFEMVAALDSISSNSDHASFYRANIPVLFFWTGIHKDYHRPTDTADRINVAGMRKITDLSEEVVLHLMSEPKRPELLKIAIRGMGGSGRIAKLGVAPDYTDKGPGLLIESVTSGGPAEKAGLKAGDRIVEIAGQQVTNLGTYMAIMGRQQPGRPLQVTVQRGDNKLSVTVTPQ